MFGFGKKKDDGFNSILITHEEVLRAVGDYLQRKGRWKHNGYAMCRLQNAEANLWAFQWTSAVQEATDE
jgi:hypothetical protein